MKINAPTTRAVMPGDVRPAAKDPSPTVFGRWTSGFTEFPGPSKTGQRTQAVLNSQPPATEEITSNLAAELAREQSQVPFL